MRLELQQPAACGLEMVQTSRWARLKGRAEIDKIAYLIVLLAGNSLIPAKFTGSLRSLGELARGIVELKAREAG